MSEIQRIKKVINWLIYQEVADSEKGLADLLGYTKSSFSQIVNGRVPLSEKFVRKLCGLDKNINIVWVLKGEGEMFKVISPDGLPGQQQETVEISREAWNVIQLQAESLASRDKQIEELVGLLKEQIRDSKKTGAPSGDNATFAAAG